jgi:dipeptidase D
LDVEKEEISTKVARNFSDKGFGVKHENNYSGWYPNIHSKLLEDAIKAFKETQGKNPRVRSIHAGLECGLFIEKYPDLDIISVGPTILNVHSPQEQLSISSVENFLRFLERILNKEC